MKIGILGGTFDPPHYGHLLIANEVLHALQLDQIWFLPNQEPPHKDKSDHVSNDIRLEMLRLLIEGHPQFHINLTEIERTGKSFTYDTMHILKVKYPRYEFHFIIGADMVEYLPKWNKIEDLIKLVQFVGVGRTGHTLTTSYPVHILDIPLIDISSTIIRERIRNKETVRYLLPDKLRQYIEENNLYAT